MKKYWWVNHKQTVSQEIRGGYLWSPKVEQNGAVSQFYNNMRVASPGDFVLSFANAEIRYVGRVTDFALSSTKPADFGAAGDSWAEDGWILPVTWQVLHAPVRPKSFIDELSSLLPRKYSPIQRETGNGNQKAYFSEIEADAFQLVLAKSGMDLELTFASLEPAAIFGRCAEQLDEVVERQLTISPALSASEKFQVIKARRGQGIFRANVQLCEGSCRLTGITNQHLLIASHIKPWRSCRNTIERLDGNNGLLLTPHVDLLFDRGLISFDDNGVPLVSPRISMEDMRRMGLGTTLNMKTKNFRSEQRVYLQHHRSNVFVY